MPAQRAYGMDQEVSPWSPIITRPVLRWPDNARVALAVLVNLEHWDWEVPPQTPVKNSRSTNLKHLPSFHRRHSIS
jgi:hypothetical protein